MKTKRHISPTDLTDAQWNGIKALIPEAKPGGRPRTLCMRSVINAILSVTVTGCQWRMLPKAYPTWQRCSASFRRLCCDGTWQRLHDQRRARVRRQAGRHTHPTAGALDSQRVTVAAHPGVRDSDAGKKGTGRKRHILVETMGLLMAVVITAASVSDVAEAKMLLSRLGGACTKLRRMWVDGAYRGRLLEWVKLHDRLLLHPVVRCDDQKGFVVLPRRWVVERTFGWLTQCRRLNTDDETLVESSQAMNSIAMIRLLVRRLAST